MIVIFEKVYVLEYRIRWEVDGQENFKKWHPPQFLVDAVVFKGSIKHATLCWNSKGVVGVVFTSNNSGVFMINFDELKYEFEDNSIKSTVKKLVSLKYDGTRDKIMMSINKFTDDVIKKFDENDFKVREQMNLS